MLRPRSSFVVWKRTTHVCRQEANDAMLVKDTIALCGSDVVDGERVELLEVKDAGLTKSKGDRDAYDAFTNQLGS